MSGSMPGQYPRACRCRMLLAIIVRAGARRLRQ
ncbi:Uncharacterised protein [Mycobacteroides abscessus subsp. abscessus]|nr:Uncharacterised protein [Mycobacteroides abscessus subsp. abscessus]SKT68462.1 Uncharacterised protein [Mycobacteroides abscessus subsp. abscessus]